MPTDEDEQPVSDWAEDENGNSQEFTDWARRLFEERRGKRLARALVRQRSSRIHHVDLVTEHGPRYQLTGPFTAGLAVGDRVYVSDTHEEPGDCRILLCQVIEAGADGVVVEEFELQFDLTQIAPADLGSVLEGPPPGPEQLRQASEDAYSSWSWQHADDENAVAEPEEEEDPAERARRDELLRQTAAPRTRLARSRMAHGVQLESHRGLLVGGVTAVHSDRGAQYTSWAFGQRLREAGLLGSIEALYKAAVRWPVSGTGRSTGSDTPTPLT